MITSIRNATNEEWDYYVDSVESAVYFQTREWFDIWADYAGFQNDTRLILFDNGKKVLVPLTYMNLFNGFFKVYFLAPKGMGGILTHDELDADEKKELFIRLQKVGILYFVANPYDTLTNESTIFNRSDVTQVLDLREGFEPLFKRWSMGHHSAVTRGIRKGITVDTASTAEDWSSYYQIYRHSLAHWGQTATNSYQSDLFDSMFRKRSGKIKLWVARYQGHIISGALCFYHNKHVAAWHGATDREFLKLNGPHMVQYFSIRHAVENGFTYYDFLQSGGHAGVVHFKNGFGTQKMPVNIYMSSSLKLADAVRTRLRNNIIYKSMMKHTGF